MGYSAEQKAEMMRVFKCLSPLVFPALGLIIGIFFGMFLPGGAWWGLATKLLMACYSLLGWAAGVCFIQQKRLYCGATQTMTSDELSTYSKRYGFGGFIILSGFLLSTLGIFGAANAKLLGISPIYGFLVYFLCLPTTFSILVGEIGWEDPLKFFKMALRIGKK